MPSGVTSLMVSVTGRAAAAAPSALRGLDDFRDQLRGDEGAGAVVEDEDLGVARRVEGGAGAGLAGVAAEDRLAGLGEVGEVGVVADEDRSVDGGMVRVGVVGAAPDGLAADRVGRACRRRSGRRDQRRGSRRRPCRTEVRGPSAG